MNELVFKVEQRIPLDKRKRILFNIRQKVRSVSKINRDRSSIFMQDVFFCQFSVYKYAVYDGGHRLKFAF